jgi:hypothetical protein
MVTSLTPGIARSSLDEAIHQLDPRGNRSERRVLVGGNLQRGKRQVRRLEAAFDAGLDEKGLRQEVGSGDEHECQRELERDESAHRALIGEHTSPSS